MATKKHTKPRVSNPDKVPATKLRKGYRFLDKDEIKRRKTTKRVHVWLPWEGGRWDFTSGWSGNSKTITYCTRLTREQLAKLR